MIASEKFEFFLALISKSCKCGKSSAGLNLAERNFVLAMIRSPLKIENRKIEAGLAYYLFLCTVHAIFRN